jgi:hypothetical protein
MIIEAPEEDALASSVAGRFVARVLSQSAFLAT